MIVTGNPDIVSIFAGGGVDAVPDAPEVSPGRLIGGVTVVVCTYMRRASMALFLDSLAAQTRTPHRLVVVDASPEDDTERMLRSRPGNERLAGGLLYCRVKGNLKGLTRQRNFGVRFVATDLIVFFDDDVILRPSCLAEMEKPFREGGGEIVGVGGFTEGIYQPPDRLWRTRCKLGIVANLRPGSYQRSGMSVPWMFLPPTQGIVAADFLPGCGMMWKTTVLREVGFGEMFDGYAQGEDLDFSLRARRHGRLVIAGAAVFQHLFDVGGRPDQGKLGYMAIYNRFHIQRRGLDDRTWRDVAWFAYAWGLDTLMLLRNLPVPSRTRGIFLQIGGRIRATFDLLRGR